MTETSASKTVASAISDLKRKVKSVSLAEPLPAISTGVIAFDRITGGGLPLGRLTELYGDWSSGKSVLAYHIIALVQALGGIAILIDTEGSLNEPWAKSLGINLDLLIYFEPMSFEDAYGVMEDCVLKVRAMPQFANVPIVVVLDSVAGTSAKADDEGEFGTSPIALKARISSSSLPRLTRVMRETKSAFLFINQLRDKPMVMYGDKEETTGGRAIKFHSSLRLHMKKSGGKKGKILDEASKRVIGMSGSLLVTKSKVCPPFQSSEFELFYEGGIPRMSGLLGVCVNDGLVQSTGGWFKVGDEKFRSVDFTEELYNKALELGVQDVDTRGEDEDSEEEQTGG